jgi:O-acetyl-ADP-ribose deacetylase (regulator of RNase III)
VVSVIIDDFQLQVLSRLGQPGSATTTRARKKYQSAKVGYERFSCSPAEGQTGGMKIELVKGDITTIEVDAVVNAANHSLLGGGGVDGAIHRRGGKAILEECKKIRAEKYPEGLPTGQSVATTAGNLPARWVIHTVGPTFAKTKDKSDLLRSCYSTSMTIADELGARTIAFPLISSGVYRWPKDDAIRQALQVFRTADSELEQATLVLYDAATLTLAEEIFAG